MKKITAACLLLVLLVCTACASAGQTKDAKIDYGTSDTFSEAEIKAAADCVLREFRDFTNCTLTALWYHEADSAIYVRQYMYAGKGAQNSITQENALALFADFTTGEMDADTGFASNTSYDGWCFILVRDSADGAWRVDDMGY